MENKDHIITRTFDAPIEKVWKAWTDAGMIKKWWGPRDFTNPVAEWDPKTGGLINIVMHGPKETDFDMDFSMRGVFKELEHPKKIVFSTDALSTEGKSQMEALITVTFESVDGKTKVTLNIHVIRSEPEFADSLAGMEQGWNQSLDKLAELLKE